jgi:membrane protease YdiL (CAAX protease family)
MKNSGGLLPLKNQKPFIQLLVALMVILLVSTVLLVITMLSGRLVFGMGMGDISPGIIEINSSQRAFIKYIQALQHISIFLIPSLCVACLMTGRISGYLKINKTPDLLSLILTVVLALFLIPLISDLGIWNSRVIMPEWLEGLEKWMFQKETEAARLTGWLIYSGSVGGLFLNIIIIAVIPAIGEEFLFRGLFQDIFTGLFKSQHTGIIITAILFGVFHMQFYGLVPRVVLGLVYGYLFFWSGSIWLPVLAHFFNNLVPVIIAYLVGWENINSNFHEYMHGDRYSTFIPLAFSLLLIFIIRYRLKESNSEK